MSTYVFLGPSLALDEARTVLDAQYLPPVRQGEVYELVRAGLATRLAVIDGHFSQVPAVWHKELLFALDRGVEVYGAASMGALRAAELAAFGMQGEGVIFRAYQEGCYPGFAGEPFEDDDEVALIHGPGELGHRPLSEAMVNLRASLNAAHAAGVIDAHARAVLARCAKARFYPERTLARSLADGAAQGLEPAMLRRLEQWWPAARVDQKALDARALLSRLAASSTARPRVAFQFEHTAAFEALTRAVACHRPPAGSPQLDSVLDELRLTPARYRAMHGQAVAALLGVEVREGDDSVALDARRGHTRALADVVAGIPASALHAQLRAQLAACGAYPALARRSSEKARCLAGLDTIPAVHELHGLEILHLEEWYFGTVLGEWIPDDVDAHAAQLGFESLAHFHRALVAEYLFRQHAERVDGV